MKATTMSEIQARWIADLIKDWAWTKKCEDFCEDCKWDACICEGPDSTACPRWAQWDNVQQVIDDFALILVKAMERKG